MSGYKFWPSAIPDSLPDHLTREFMDRILEPIYSDWFRTQVLGSENIPRSGGALLVVNHAGAFAIDGLITMMAVAKNSERRLKVLGADFLFELGVNDLLSELGVEPADSATALSLLELGELVGVWPEGVRGVSKTFDQRYQLQQFGRGGFAKLALQVGVPIIPTAIIGAEEAYPLVGRISGVLDWVNIPYVPVTPTFPALGPLGLVPLPSCWSVEFGTPISPERFRSQGKFPGYDVFELADYVKGAVNEMLMSGLSNRSRVFSQYEN